MTLDASLRNLDTALEELREAVSGLRVAVVEDGPSTGAPALVDQLGDAATDMLGWVEAGSERIAELARLDRPRDLDSAQRALLSCQEHLVEIDQRFAADLFNCERIGAVRDLARRGRPWRLWSQSVQQALDKSRQKVGGAQGSVLACWREIAELYAALAAGARTVFK